MSRVRTNLSCGGPASFLSLVVEGSTRQSATAATRIAASAGSAAKTALAICSAVSMSMRSTPAGVSNATGPATSVTLAPASAAAEAIANPCRPDERLAITRTGSIGSCVGPAVTTMCLPLKSSLAAELRGRGTAGGGGGGDLSCIDGQRNRLEHAIEILQHFDGRDAHHPNVLTCQPIVSRDVSLGAIAAIVRFTIDFDS